VELFQQVESTPEVVYHKINQEAFSPTDSLVTATSLEDMASPSNNSPLTLGKEVTASLPHQRSSSAVFANTPVQVGIPLFHKMYYLLCLPLTKPIQSASHTASKLDLGGGGGSLGLVFL
jgi:hypothetical protein